LLRVDGLHVRYGSVVAVRDATFALAPATLTTLTGPNGAGKTSTLSAIAGVVAFTGAVRVGGTEMGDRPAHQRAAAGLAFVPDGRRVFGRLTVEQNLAVATVKMSRDAARAALTHTYDRFALLQARRAQRADTLSGGEAQLLMIARALIGAPTVLMVDEPFQGLSAEATHVVLDALRAAASGGAAVLVATPEPVDGIDAIRMNHGSTLEVVA
jgi:branched-chain amino acid transport system ATP-binding protein